MLGFTESASSEQGMAPPNHKFQPTSSPSLRYGEAAAELGRWASRERESMKARVIFALLTLTVLGCEMKPSAPPPEFELRDFVITEEVKEATEYSKAWNEFTGKGTLVSRNVAPERTLLVNLEIHDKTMGVDAEPRYVAVLFKGGLGKVEIGKSKYGEMSKRPDYVWSVLGWQELHKASIKVISSQPSP